MEISLVRRDRARVACLLGRLDALGAPLLERRLAEELDAGSNVFVIDMAGVDYVSSAGLRCLLIFGKKISQSHGKLALCNMNPMVEEVFTISGFRKVFAIEPCLDDAVSRVCLP